MKTLEDDSRQFKVKMKQAVLPRRAVLRDTLAVGCGLLIPAILLGCDSGKTDSATSAAPAGSPDTSGSPDTRAESPAPAQAGKVPQASVQYQTQPKGEQKCSGCVQFIAESNSCKVVEGQISPDGWCTLWAPKA
jgi:hypothetical protein